MLILLFILTGIGCFLISLWLLSVTFAFIGVVISLFWTLGSIFIAYLGELLLSIFKPRKKDDTPYKIH
jgi:hypothetical protein